jgi:hypothetical protein
MATQEIKNNSVKLRFTSAFKDLMILAFIAMLVFVLSYFFNVFTFLVEFFQKSPQALTWVDEIITGLLTLSIGFAIFSWRRWRELKKEAIERLRLQVELTKIAETKAETERIICKQLHCDIEEYRKIEKDILSRQPKQKEQFK